MGFNSPLPMRLQEETRKAAKIVRSFVGSNNNGLDKVIPRHVLERAAGFAIFTVFKAGFLVSARAGTGVVIARTQDGSWSAPSAIGLGGFGFGGQAGAEVTDFLIVLNNRQAVAGFMAAGNLTVGGNLSVAVGPLGRNAEGSGSVNSKGKIAAMYSYSKTRGLFGGVSVEGSVIVERQDANRLAYGGSPTAKQILSGAFDPPDWAGVLIEELDRATGLPGGQRWRGYEEEGEGEGGGMGWSSPGRDGERGAGGGGYIFNDGIGSGANSPDRAGDAFPDRAGPGLGGGAGGGRRRAGSLFGPDRTVERERQRAGSVGDRSAVRPGGMFKRSSSFNPFSGSGSGANSPKRSAPLASSESYNAGLTWDSSGPMTGYGTRSRSGSNALAYSSLPDNDSKGGRGTGSRSRNDDLLGDFDSSRDRRGFDDGNGDLLGGLDDDDRGLAASFNRLKTSEGNRSRSNSKPMPFDNISEEYVPYETTSSFAKQRAGGSASISNPRLGSGERSPFADPDSTSYFRDQPDLLSNGRAFEEYSRRAADGTSNGGSNGAGYGTGRALPPKPPLPSRQSSGSNEGYARGIALFDFNATDAGDLGMKARDSVIILDRVGNGEWWKGRSPSSGKEGIFPSNYVEVVELPKELKGGVYRSELRARMASNMFD